MSAGDSDNFMLSYCKQLLRGWKQPVLVLFSVLLLGAGFVLATGFPVFRASLYPFNFAFSSIHGDSDYLHADGYSYEIAKDEKPTFCFFTSSYLFYRFRIFERADLLNQAKGESTRRLFRITKCEDIPALELDRIGGACLYERSGFFVPHDLKFADVRLTPPDRLAPGSYLAVMEARSLIGKRTRGLLWPFRIVR
ncbi:hypothetical protein GC174_02175 [bacterium]|nr:hypothetical protein [bacterium]